MVFDLQPSHIQQLAVIKFLSNRLLSLNLWHLTPSILGLNISTFSLKDLVQSVGNTLEPYARLNNNKFKIFKCLI